MGQPAPNENKTNGQIAYEAYSEALGWKSGVTGQPLPPWAEDKITPAIKAGWEAAAQAVLDARPADAIGKAA